MGPRREGEMEGGRQGNPPSWRVGRQAERRGRSGRDGTSSVVFGTQEGWKWKDGGGVGRGGRGRLRRSASLQLYSRLLKKLLRRRLPTQLTATHISGNYCFPNQTSDDHMSEE